MTPENKDIKKENPRRNFLKNAAKGSIAALSIPGFAASAMGMADTKRIIDDAGNIKPDHTIRSVPENMVWGYYGADVPPVATVKDGDVVAIQTINTTGIRNLFFMFPGAFICKCFVRRVFRRTCRYKCI